MVTGIEAAGLTLAILPLFVNQIDAYVRGIEKIKVLRRYRRELKGYSVGLGTQHAILLNTLEQALEDVVNDEDQVSELIRDPQGDGWKDPDLQNRLRWKLDRNYEVFIDNVTGLSGLLKQLSHKLEIGETDMKTPATETWNIWKFRKIISKAVYDDLLAKIDKTNSILKTLVDQSVHREDTKKRRRTWSYLLKRYQKARKHAEGLFKAIIGGSCWRCQCKEQHCVHLQLQTNPLQSTEEYSERDFNATSQLRMIFSNTNEGDPTCLWTWTEVIFEPWRIEEIVTSRSLYDDFKSHHHKKPKARFDIPPVEEARPSEQVREVLSAPPIQDLCSSLCVAKSHVGLRGSLGSISNELDASVKYTMHAVKILPKAVPQKPLREVLSHISRRDRLYIAAGLACGVIQFCGNWLKPWWDSSDVYLAAASDGRNVLLDNLYLPWPLSSTGTIHRPRNDTNYSDLGDNRLLPLGLALVELSLGKCLHTLLGLEDENQDTLVTKFKTASWLVKMVYMESGTNYADAVNSCLSWSAQCLEKRFEERVFDTIVSPLLKDLVNFEGIA